MDLRNKTIKDFKTQTQLEMTTSETDTTLQALEATQEGLQKDKIITQRPTIIPTNLLPKPNTPQHYKPIIIRANGYRRNSRGQLVEDTAYIGRRCIHLVE
jgi:hypothetical protein